MRGTRAPPRRPGASRTASVSMPHWLPSSADTPGRDDLREQRRAGLADDQRGEHGREQPRPRRGVLRAGRAERRERRTRRTPGPEDHAEHDADDGRDDDVAGPPRAVDGTGARRMCGGRRYPSIRIPPGNRLPPPPSRGRRRRDSGPASFAGMSRIRFCGSVVGPHSQRSRAPRRRYSVAVSVARRDRSGSQAMTSAMTSRPSGSLWSSWRRPG